MKIRMFKKAISVLLLFVSFVFVSSAVAVYAAPSENASAQAQAIKTNKSTPSGQNQACEARMANVQTRSQNMVHTATTLMSRIGAIETKVEEFYQNRLVNAGLELENFDDLQAQIQAKQRVVEMNMEDATKTAANFNCNNDPRGQVNQFGTQMRTVTRAMNDYKTAVRNMLVAIHRVSLNVEAEE